MLQGSERNVQAETCLMEAIRMQLEDAEIFEEIGDLYRQQNNHKLAILCYNKVVEHDPKRGEGWEKLGQAHCEESNQNQDIPSAIEAYKEAIELIAGEQNKNKIALLLQELFQIEGREEEIEPYRKYMLEMTLTEDGD